MKRRNISEELNINDFISLDDGSERKDDLEKEADKLEKENQEIIDDKIKDFEEIRDAEAPKLKANDGLGKTLKIKKFVEKIVLEEPSNTLNENNKKKDLNEDFDDFLFKKRSDAVHAVYNVLESYVDTLMTTDVDILDECETVCEEALVHLEDAINSGEF